MSVWVRKNGFDSAYIYIYAHSAVAGWLKAQQCCALAEKSVINMT
jgi:hypothetical protein